MLVFSIIFSVFSVKYATAFSMTSSDPLQSSCVEVGNDSHYDLWIAGCGTLGTKVITSFLKKNPNARIVAETRTASKHAMLRQLGAIPRLRKNRTENDMQRSRCVLISFPPYSRGMTSESDQNYPFEVAEACKLWNRSALNDDEFSNSLLLVSSTGIYGSDKFGVFTESSPVDTTSSRTIKLLEAEQQVTLHNGTAIRLAGLYDIDTGPANYWLQEILHNREGKLSVAPDGILNLVSYDDAADACVVALLNNAGAKSGGALRTYVISDGTPTSRLDLLHTAVRDMYTRHLAASGMEAGQEGTWSSGEDGGDGGEGNTLGRSHATLQYLKSLLDVKKLKEKFLPSDEVHSSDGKGDTDTKTNGHGVQSFARVIDGRLSNRVLGWSPCYTSFKEFIDKKRTTAP